MEKHSIKNFDELAITENRKMALQVIEAGIDAIDTKKAINNFVKLSGNFLHINLEKFDLSKFKNIKVVGFGKSSCESALALEEILGDKIKVGAVACINKTETKHIETFVGTHPRPSLQNNEAGKKIYEIVKDSKEDDLIIVLVSGGGSSLLCYGEDECTQSAKLYDSFLKTGKTISEMNTVRKHLSILKGGGLAKLAYPATVIGLIFSDVPGDVFLDVASGPTYKDETTVKDAQKIIDENNLGAFDLIETPKEDKYFKKVHNFVLVSNRTAVEAMKEEARDLGLVTKIVSYNLYDEVSMILRKIVKIKNKNTFSNRLKKWCTGNQNEIVLAAGEPSIVLKEDKNIGKGGRNTQLSLLALKEFKDKGSVFISFASDGMDNSDAAGAVVDVETLRKAEEQNLSIDKYLENYDSYNFFLKTGDLIITGPTGANVSDLMLLLTKK